MHSPLRAVAASILAALIVAAPAGAFENGRAPQSALAPIFTPQPGKVAYLVKGSASASWNTMNLCVVATGRAALSPGDSVHQPAATAYRTLNVQRILFRQLGPRLAASPGRSNHGRDVTGAVDLRAPPMQAVIRSSIGGTFGWFWGEVPHEWWHVTRRAGHRFTRPDPGASFRYPRLKRGSGGRCQANAVREIQRRVGVPQDGEFGKATSKGVRRIQKSKAFRKYLAKHKLRRSPLGVVQSPEWIAMRKLGRRILDKNGGGTTVRPNTEGQDVRAVQGLLAARLRELDRPKSICPIDGRWDTCDKRALKKFQHLVGLEPTGVAGPKDVAALRKPRGSATRLDAAGIQFLAREEGVVLHTYHDSAGHCTAGVGHLVRFGRCRPSDVARYRNLTHAGAFRLLRDDVRSRELVVTRSVRVRLRQGELNAYVSLTFNIGNGGWLKSTALRRLNAGDRRGACDALLLWHRGGRPNELLPRRKRERALCLRR
jgi:lysozyme